MRDRIVQLVALLLAGTFIVLGGGLLPTIVEKAGQDHLLVAVVDPETRVRMPEVEIEKIYTSMIRKLSTVEAVSGDDDVEVGYDARTKTWTGSLGDVIKVKWRDGGETREVTGILEARDGYGLRYTDSSVEGAPPIVALGTAIGALRGVIVDYLWLKVNMMKEDGEFYEVMSDAELITKLQPRFAQVWGFHGHNMAYNISVMTNTPEERWDWVTAGIDLVRNQGLRYNPNDVVLHKDLAFWFAHKIDGVSDDAHFHYKKQFAEEWHYLLGPAPFDHEKRIAWIKAVADAPESLEEAEARVPGTQEVVDELSEALDAQGPQFRMNLDGEFLINLGRWLAVKNSPYARILGLDSAFKANDPVYAAFDRVLSDPKKQAAVLNFLAFLRAKVLREEYNMNPNVMYEFTRDIGPLDWRHPQAHALYWARLGTERGSKRYEGVEDVHKVINNDRIWLQAMQALARSGLLSVDPMSQENPGRLSDPRWIRAIDRYFREVYDKHYDSRGGGGDSFSNFHENFMKQAVRELWRAGEYKDAEEMYAYLDSLYGVGGVIPSSTYSVPIEQFVKNQATGEYEMQPEVARSDVYASLRRGFREGLLLDRPEVLEDAIRFAGELTAYFKGNESNDYVNKFGAGRIKDLIGDLETSVRDVFRVVLLDRSLPLIDRLQIYNLAGDEQKRMAYDAVKAEMESEFMATPLAQAMQFQQAFPEPPGMDAYRKSQAIAAEAAKARREAVDVGAEKK
ncbi:MAG: hypothetical protein CMJ67_06220 [Planctomycetaceae bacterium]|nr:hypothetical protein [Planctomycetaceae bacterium]